MFPYRVHCLSYSPLRSIFAMWRGISSRKCGQRVSISHFTEISTPTPSLQFTFSSGLRSRQTTYNPRCRLPAKPPALRSAPVTNRPCHLPGSSTVKGCLTVPVLSNHTARFSAGQQASSAAAVPAGGRCWGIPAAIQRGQWSSAHGAYRLERGGRASPVGAALSHGFAGGERARSWERLPCQT